VKRWRNRSLGGRLSLWLAVQTFIGLGLVSLTVLFFFADDLQQRQREALVHKKELVLHVVAEASEDHDLANLKHKFDDFFLGHPDAALTLRRPDGSVLYDNAWQADLPPSVRGIEFSYPSWEPSGGELSVRVILSKATDDQLLNRLAAILLGAALVGALAVSLGSFVLVRMGLGPVHLLVEQARQLTADKLRQHLDGSAQPLELQPLVEQFNELLERLSRTYDQLEAFNADVAHELRTPLTTMITSIELTVRRPHDSQAVADLLGSNLEELRRMTAIVNDMLFLSHASCGAVARRESLRSLAALAFSVAEYHEAAMTEANVQFVVKGDASAALDAALLKRALSNLLDNATRYALPQSTVRIEIANDQPGYVTFSVVNKGRPIDPTHLDRVFDRFYRADASRSQASTNHGLGLSIVAAIARMHRGEPFAHSSAGETCVGFTVPVS
jgi:two-component system, OmpR family, heavy metal sensor histidine kinase CusS